jgi:hypothetical protein
MPACINAACLKKIRLRTLTERTLLISFAVILFLLGLGSGVYADLVSESRTVLFNQGNPTYSGMVSTNQKFKEALAAAPNNHEANLFYAITLIAAFALESGWL